MAVVPVFLKMEPFRMEKLHVYLHTNGTIIQYPDCEPIGMSYPTSFEPDTK